LLEDWGVEGDYEGIGHCIVGYIDGKIPEAAPRKSNYVILCMNMPVAPRVRRTKTKPRHVGLQVPCHLDTVSFTHRFF